MNRVAALGCTLGLSLLVSVAGPVQYASADDNPTGGGSKPGEVFHQDAQELSDLAAKLRDAEAYRRGIEAARRNGAQRGGVTPMMCNPDVQCPTSSNSLPVTHVAQSENWRCGSASGTMILRTLGAGPSYGYGETLNQTNVGNTHHMWTDYNRETTWASGLFRTGLNNWRNSNYYVNLAAPTNSQFQSSLGYDIDHGYPFGVSTLELSGKAHYNFHPTSQQIGHWIVAQAYMNWLSNVSFDDPAGGSSALSSAWSGVQPDFTAATNTFNQTWVQSHGITW